MGSFGGSLSAISATQLGAIAIKGALAKINLDPNKVEEVYMGNVLQANLGQAPARQAAIFAGLPNTVPATTVNKVCASGMKAVMLAAQSIMLGDNDIVVAGGMESMSQTPHYLAGRSGNKFGNISMLDGITKDGLLDVYSNVPMGNCAELCAEKYEITREDQDNFAITSYKRAAQAWEDGKFSNEVVPVPVPQRKGDPIVITKDEEPFQVKFDKIPQLSPAFIKDGTVTAANASTMNDGAAALVLMAFDKAIELGLKPLAIVRAHADAEQAPEWFTTSPSLAIPAAVKKAGLDMDQIEYWEINEAFSVVALENMKRLKLDPARVNVYGGAVSLGHPLGCSGARILVTLINVLNQHQARYGAAGICNGGGGASALVLERVF